jgi:hypothetical protein
LEGGAIVGATGGRDYDVLRTIEDIFGVKPLNNAASADVIKGVIK